jgi:hypothetical protein
MKTHEYMDKWLELPESMVGEVGGNRITRD